MTMHVVVQARNLGVVKTPLSLLPHISDQVLLMLPTCLPPLCLIPCARSLLATSQSTKWCALSYDWVVTCAAVPYAADTQHSYLLRHCPCI